MQFFDIFSELDYNIFDSDVSVYNEPYLLANTCFPGNTKVNTDQGRVRMDDLDLSKHTIHGKRIVAVTRTKTLDKKLVLFRKNCLRSNMPSADTYVSQAHGILRKGRLVKAVDFVGQEGVTAVPYGGCVLFNVLLEEHATMRVNNMICETLHPNHRVAQMHRLDMGETDRVQFIKILNSQFLKELARRNKLPALHFHTLGTDS